MENIYLSLGSNIHADRHITSALHELRKTYGELSVSPIYESESVGFEGDNFLNLIVGITFLGKVGELAKALKDLENKIGRVRGGPKFGPRVIDIDIILFGDCSGIFDGIELPRGELTENAYVLLPLMELAPHTIDPNSGKTMQQLWQEKSYLMSQQKLWLADFQYNIT